MRRLPANARVEYREYPVPESLRRHVAGLWLLRDPAPAAGTQTIYPDGHCELIVHFGTPPECLDDHGWHAQASTLFAAQRLGPVRLRRTQPLDCLGVRLRSEASDLLGAAALASSRERIVDLGTLDAGLSHRLATSARAFVGGDTALLHDVLEQRCAGHVMDVAVARAVADIRAGGGQARVETVARASGLALRSLQIRFRRAVGLTLKEFSRLMRLQATLRALDAEDGSITDLAMDRGFSDHAHATRELRRVTGLAPARLRAALRADRDGDAAVRLAAAFVRSGG
jgi:AraC-like DNA-binding protein